MAHCSVNSLAPAMPQLAAQEANASLSQRSSHHCIVTRSPNHMCAISWKMNSARTARCAWVGGVRKSWPSP